MLGKYFTIKKPGPGQRHPARRENYQDKKPLMLDAEVSEVLLVFREELAAHTVAAKIFPWLG